MGEITIIDERTAHQMARERAEQTGQPHGVRPDKHGGWCVAPLTSAYQPLCVCGDRTHDGRLCVECALVLSTNRRDAAE